MLLFIDSHASQVGVDVLLFFFPDLGSAECQALTTLIKERCFFFLSLFVTLFRLISFGDVRVPLDGVVGSQHNRQQTSVCFIVLFSLNPLFSLFFFFFFLCSVS